MPLTVTAVASRQALQADPENDFQSWIRIAGDGLPPRWLRMRSAQGRCWCSITDHQTLMRQEQGGSFNGHMPTPGELVLWTNHNPGRTFRVDFKAPVRGVGLDVEPTPPAVIPGERSRAELEVIDLATGHTGHTGRIERTANGGTSTFLGLRSPDDGIGRIEVRVVMLDTAGAERPVDFGVNRIERKRCGRTVAGSA